MEGSEGTTILDRVRSSAQYVKQHAKDVTIDDTALQAFVNGLDLDEFASVVALKRLPITFTSVADETNFYALVNLLNFGSGFRVPLHDACQRGAYDTILRGVLSMQLSGERLDSPFLKNLSLLTVGSLFDIPLYEDKPLEEGIFYISSPGPLHPLGVMLQQVLNQTGQILESKGCTEGLGEWILSCAKDGPGGGSKTAAQLVEALVNTFPALDDKATFQGQEVFILKKAQILVADLYRRLKDKEPAYRFTDIDRLTTFSDNVLPAVLRQLGILKLSESLATHIDQQRELKPGDQEVELRCLAVQACEEILAAFNSHPEKLRQWKEKHPDGEPFNSLALDLYLWKKGKEKGFREVDRHYTRDTLYY